MTLTEKINSNENSISLKKSSSVNSLTGVTDKVIKKQLKFENKNIHNLLQNMLTKMIKTEIDDDDIFSQNKLLSSQTPIANESIIQDKTEQKLKYRQSNIFHLENSSKKEKIPDDSDQEKPKNRSINKTKKVDDSVSSKDDELIVNYEESKFIIDLDSRFISIWDIIIITLTFYTILVTPYILAFLEDDIQLLIAFEAVMDVIFIIDVIFQFFIPFYNDKEVYVKNLSLIARRYIRSWFLIDIAASIPGTMIILIINGLERYNSNKLGTMNKVARITKYYKIIKFSKLIKILKVSNNPKDNPYNKIAGIAVENSSSGIKRLFSFMINFIMISHMITCIWIFIGKELNPSWITEFGFTELSDSDLYLASLYFHWVSIFTIGYGDITSKNSTERLYNCFLLFIGVFVYSFTVSQISNILTSDDESTSRHLKNLNILQSLENKYNIPQNFYKKIYRFLTHNHKFNKIEGYGFINELPPKIRNSLLFEMYDDVLARFHFFFDKSADFTAKVLFCLKPIRMLKKEYIISEGHHMEEVVFVRKGILSIHLSAKYNDYHIMNISMNEHFGDILAMSNQRSPVTIKVYSKTAEILLLKREDLIDISKEFPDSLEEIFIVSSYNFSALLETIEFKKNQVREKNKILKQNSLNNNKFKQTEFDRTITRSSPTASRIETEECEEKVKDIQIPNILQIAKKEKKKKSFKLKGLNKNDKLELYTINEHPFENTHRNLSENKSDDYVKSFPKKLENIIMQKSVNVHIIRNSMYNNMPTNIIEKMHFNNMESGQKQSRNYDTNNKVIRNSSDQKMIRSTLLLNDISNNFKKTKAIEQNPTLYFKDEFKEIMHNQLEEEIGRQEKKIEKLAKKIYNKKVKK
jgi:hypothetical protein